MVMTSWRVQPSVLAIEDLRWADPTTLDWHHERLAQAIEMRLRERDTRRR
jgi:hypothetical protein